MSKAHQTTFSNRLIKTSPHATCSSCMCTRTYHELPWQWVGGRPLGGLQRDLFVKAPLLLIWWKLVRWRRLSEQICCNRSSLEKYVNNLTRVSIYILLTKKTITTQQADPSDLLLRMLGESNSKNYGQQVDVLNCDACSRCRIIEII